MFLGQTYLSGSPQIKSFNYRFQLADNSDFFRYFLRKDPVIESGIVRNLIIFPTTVVSYGPTLGTQPNQDFNRYARLTLFTQDSQEPSLYDYPFSLLNPFYGGVLLNAGFPGGHFPRFNLKVDLNRSYFQLSNNGSIPAGDFVLRFQFVMEFPSKN